MSWMVPSIVVALVIIAAFFIIMLQILRRIKGELGESKEEVRESDEMYRTLVESSPS